MIFTHVIHFGWSQGRRMDAKSWLRKESGLSLVGWRLKGSKVNTQKTGEPEFARKRHLLSYVHAIAATDAAAAVSWRRNLSTKDSFFCWLANDIPLWKPIKIEFR